VLALLGDSVTTDHISARRVDPKDSPAGRYWWGGVGVPPTTFNSYGAGRGNHDVMVRGTFANIRSGTSSFPMSRADWTAHLPTGEG